MYVPLLEEMERECVIFVGVVPPEEFSRVPLKCEVNLRNTTRFERTFLRFGN